MFLLPPVGTAPLGADMPTPVAASPTVERKLAVYPPRDGGRDAAACLSVDGGCADACAIANLSAAVPGEGDANSRSSSSNDGKRSSAVSASPLDGLERHEGTDGVVGGCGTGRGDGEAEGLERSDVASRQRRALRYDLWSSSHWYSGR